MQNNKNQPSLFEPAQIRKFPLNREAVLVHHKNSGPHNTSKDSPDHHTQQPQAKYSPSEFRDHIFNNSHTSGFNTYSHRISKQTDNKFQDFKKANDFHGQSLKGTNQKNPPPSPSFPKKNQLLETRLRKNSQVISPTYKEFDFSVFSQNSQMKQFQQSVGKIEGDFSGQKTGNKGEQASRFRKPEVFQSMLLQKSENNNRASSGDKMKKSAICTNFSNLMPQSEKFRHNTPNLESFKSLQSLKHVKSEKNYLQNEELYNHFHSDGKQQQSKKIKQDLNFSPTFLKNSQMKYSCIVQSPPYEQSNFHKKAPQDTSDNSNKSKQLEAGSPMFLRKIHKSKGQNSHEATPTKNQTSEVSTNNFPSMKKRTNFSIHQQGNSQHHLNFSQETHFIRQKQKKETHRVPSENTIFKHTSPTHTNFQQFKKRSPQFIKTHSQQHLATQNTDFLEFIKKKPSTPVHKNFTMEDFEIIEKLGKGAFGDVFLVQEKQTKMICVVKVLSKQRIKEQKLEEHVLREIKIQSYLCHKHLVALYGVFDDKNKIYLVMQYLNDGNLSLNKRKITQAQTAYLIKQILDGLNFMHCENIIHRDIKPDNLFMFESYVKIGDFGCSVFSNTLRRTVVGCLAYISPQQLNNNAYDEKIDVWSIGVLTYELLMGKSPFEEDLKQMAKIQYQNRLTNDSQSTNLQGCPFPELKFPENCSVTIQTQKFIKNLLSEDPDDRMTIKQALKHSFIQKSNEWQRILQEKFSAI